jgi:hypothetical protein
MRRFLAAAAALVACTPVTPPAGKCTTSADCPTDWLCLFSQCASPETLFAGLSAVVWPSDPALAPQQYQPFELNPSGTPQSSIAIVLHQPQRLTGSFVLPACCPSSALPVRMSFVGRSVIPGMDWSFFFGTDSQNQNQASGVLPSFESFQQTITPSEPCSPPLLGTHRTFPGVFDVGQFVQFPAPQDSLRVIGSLVTDAGSVPTGALVSLLSSAGEPLSITVPLDAGTFDLRVPLSQAVQACDGGCASLVLSLAPENTYLPGSTLLSPTIDVPVTATVVTPDGGPDAGICAEIPTAVVGLPLVLPYDDNPMYVSTLSGTTLAPDGGAAGGLTVIVQSSSLSYCSGDCSYKARVVSSSVPEGPYAVFNLQVPFGGYYISVAPDYQGQNGWFTNTTTVSCVSPTCQNGDVQVRIQEGVTISGQVVRPDQTAFNDQGQVQIYTLPDMTLVSSAPLQSQGRFSVVAPQGRDLLAIVPNLVTGFPSVFTTLDDVVAPQDLGPVSLINPGLLAGTVSVENPDGGAFLPVTQATVQFFYVVSDQGNPDGGEIAIPISSSVTDSSGNFAAVGLPFAPPNP